MEKIAKWTGGIVGLCLLCCAAPLALAFLGGGSVAASALWFGQPGLPMEVAVLAGVLVMAAALWLILHRRRCTNDSCAVK